jgi:hypothetical protein
MATVTTMARGWSPILDRAGPAISDDELRRWSPGQRRALARRLAALDRADRPPTRYGRPVVVGAAGLLCLVLLAWASQLATKLPSRYEVGHWDIAWVGFDVMLAAGIAATGLAVWRRSPTAPAISLGTAVMLLCDAWFDVATAYGTADAVSSLVLAGLVELPLAVLATALAHRAGTAP